MSDKITKAHVESAFKALCDELGKRVATAYNDVGAWQLDRAYGGYNIEEILTATGAVRNPIDGRRRSTREMYETLWFATNALREKERVFAL